MNGKIIIALDCMGGDNAPASVIEGAARARVWHPDLHYIFVGDEARIVPLIEKQKSLAGAYEIIHTTEAVGNDWKVVQALREGRNTSMRLAVDAVAADRAACIVSAGNTGALMAISKFVFKMLPGIDRPAIASFFPTRRGESVMLDMGANVDCSTENYLEFALMGAVFAKTVLGILNPSIGLLNIGSEDMKGHDTLRDAHQRMKEKVSLGTYDGFVEGDDVTKGKVDVVVTDGFSGNIALKTAEGTAKLMNFFIKETLRNSFWGKIGYIIAASAFDRLKKRLDPRRYNGAMLLGLNHVCVKSHGGTDGKGFANAISVAYDLVHNGFNEQIKLQMAGSPELAVSHPDTEKTA